MHLKPFAIACAASLAFLLPSPASAACCDHAAQCCEKATGCCEKKGHTHGAMPVDELSAADPQINPAPPVRQLAEVWFNHPTLIGRAIVQGRYVIEHDTHRMARGEPCTHVYAYANREQPVATFACTHLERDRTDTNRVLLTYDASGLRKLAEFQFAGEHAAHGYPPAR